MNYRLLRILILLTVIMTISACGGSATPTATPAPTEPEPTATAEPEDTATEAAADAEETEAATEEATTDDEDEIDATEAADDDAASESTEIEAVADGTTVLVGFQNTTVRNGPGTRFEVVGSVDVGTRLPVIARTESTGTALWYLVTLESGDPAWIWSRVVELTPSDAEVEVAATIPSPP